MSTKPPFVGLFFGGPLDGLRLELSKRPPGMLFMGFKAKSFFEGSVAVPEDPRDGKPVHVYQPVDHSPTTPILRYRHLGWKKPKQTMTV